MLEAEALTVALKANQNEINAIYADIQYLAARIKQKQGSK